MDITSTAFRAVFDSVVVADMRLSRENAVVIAMTVLGLARQHPRKAIVLGSSLLLEPIAEAA